MFDNDGYQLLPDADANLHRGEQALPDILRLLDIQSDPQINYDSRNYQIHLLSDQPNSFVNKHVYQYQ